MSKKQTLTAKRSDVEKLCKKRLGKTINEFIAEKWPKAKAK